MLIDPFINAIKKYNFEVKTILDIGTRDLMQSIELHTVYPNAKIYAFEANPESYQKCLKNKPDYIELFHAAVLDYDGESQFYAVSQTDNFGASSIFEPTDIVVGVDNLNGLTKTKVPALRIDTWAKKNKVDQIDLVWLDVQGAEFPVLKGFGELLGGVKAIATEVATGSIYYPNRKYEPADHTKLKEFMELNNFEEILYDQPWPYEADVVFVKNEHSRI